MKSKRVTWSIMCAAVALFALTLTGCSFVDSLLGESSESHTHVYDQKDISFTYLATEADCENSATYYYSCACGQAGSETFVYGKPTEHPFSSEWSN